MPDGWRVTKAGRPPGWQSIGSSFATLNKMTRGYAKVAPISPPRPLTAAWKPRQIDPVWSRSARVIVVLTTMLAATAAPATTPVNSALPEIVVTGRSLGELEGELAACIARRCPTREDVTATLALAEAQFLAGDYRDARKVLNRSIDRNRKAAPDEPIAVSMLYRAASRVSLHLGEKESYVAATYRIVRALKAGRARDEAEILLSEIEAADMRAGTGDLLGAEGMLRSVQRRARSLRLNQVAALARLKELWSAYARRRDPRQAIADLRELSRVEGPDMAPYRVAARALILRLEAGREQPDPAKLAASPDPLPGRQMLVWSPPPEAAAATELGITNPASQAGGSSYRDKWADIGFRVRPDGYVEAVQVLRSEGAPDWLPHATRQVGRRVYTPLLAGTPVEADIRVERQTFTSFYYIPEGSRVRDRDGNSRIEVVDLTPDR